MQAQESDSQEPSQPEPDPSQGQAHSDPEVQADPESPEAKGEPEAQGEAPEAEAAAEEGTTPAETPEAVHKKRTGFQRKIDRLERQNQILLEQLQRGAAQAPPNAAPPKEKSQADQARDYINTLVSERLKEERANLEAQSRQAEFQRRAAEARAKYQDFDEVLASADAPVSDAVKHTLLTSERGPDIMYQLAKNPAELARLSALPPLDAAREIGRLEAKASGAAPQTPKPAVRPPAPPSRVGGSASSTRSLETLPLAEYKRAMASRRR